MKKPFYQKSVLEIDDIEKPACEYAKIRGWLVLKFVSPGRNGVPDRFFARAGRILFVEFKCPNGVPTKQQANVHKIFREHGVEVYVCNDLEYARELFK